MLLAAVCRWSADELHVHLVGDSWAPSARTRPGRADAWPPGSLPHVGAVATTDDEFIRLTRLLVATVGGRRTESTKARPQLAVLVDDTGGFRAGLSARARHAWERFEDALVAGRPRGVCAVVATDRPDAALERLLARLAATRVCLDGAAELDRAARDRSRVPPVRRGSGILVAADGTDLGELQLAEPPDDAADLPIRWRSGTAPHRGRANPDDPELGT
jgi:hypothetical protein